MAKAKQKTTTSARDPILARIATYQKLDRECFRLALVEEAGLVTEAELDRASDAVWDAGCRFARTRPTTFAGASEMLSLITTGNTTGLFPSVGWIGTKWSWRRR